MKWKCVCSAENEIDVTKCPNCKRDRPSYLRVDIKPPGNIDGIAGAELIMSVVVSVLEESDKKFDKLLNDNDREQLKPDETDKIMTELLKALKKCNRLINYLRSKFPGMVYELGEDEYNYDEIQSSVELLLGRLVYFSRHHDNAIDHFLKSYKLQSNQWALFLMVRSIMKLPVDAGGTVFKSSKVEIAREIKLELEEELLLGVVKMDHLSSIGIEAGELLIDHYGLID